MKKNIPEDNKRLLRIRITTLKKIARDGPSLQRRQKLTEIEKKAPTFTQKIKSCKEGGKID